ncbi:hypothetical protein [Nocardia cyriacigeorgica]|uniref:hypothetical protein n=1 Tax=Nocardia cyriacigeorgica TaxID=135487 RepID=UPI00189570B6|nr:hypothetical protein [Nocardia cyriacigeorgica]MBF6344210.1 hypothetical protein [Nocardia cyriacigeorgica]
MNHALGQSISTIAPSSRPMVAQPNPPSAPYAGPRPAVAGEWPSEWHPGMLWWDARTVLVTRADPAGRWNTTAHLVIPIDRGRLAFRISSYSLEMQHLARDRRVIVQAGDRLGRPAVGSRQHQGVAEFVGAGPLFDKICTGLRAKYGMRAGLARLYHGLTMGSAPYGDTAVVVNIHETSPLPPAG